MHHLNDTSLGARCSTPHAMHYLFLSVIPVLGHHRGCCLTKALAVSLAATVSHPVSKASVFLGSHHFYSAASYQEVPTAITQMFICKDFLNHCRAVLTMNVHVATRYKDRVFLFENLLKSLIDFIEERSFHCGQSQPTM